ncbi:MAG: LptF/LptG family permease, partial [Pararhodobacter sp.]
MPRIDRYILSQFTMLFGFFALVLVSVYWINRAVRLFDELLSDGQTALVVLEFTALTLPIVIATVLPVAAFAAAAYGTNRLSGESELVAMQAAGLSPWRLARPVAVFGVMVAVMVAVLVHGLVPMARARLADRQTEIAENATAQFLRPGAFQYPARGITL